MALPPAAVLANGPVVLPAANPAGGAQVYSSRKEQQLKQKRDRLSGKYVDTIKTAEWQLASLLALDCEIARLPQPKRARQARAAQQHGGRDLALPEPLPVLIPLALLDRASCSCTGNDDLTSFGVV